MSVQVQFRRGSTAEHSTFTGSVGEITVDTTKDTAIVHDGSQVGGYPLLREDQTNLPTSAPSLGIYKSGTSLGVATNGSARLYIASDGKVGVGTTSPSSLLHLGAASGTVQMQFNNGGTSSFLGHDPSVPGFDIASKDVTTFRNFNGALFAETMRITPAGLVGIGTSAPGSPLTITGNYTGTSNILELRTTAGGVDGGGRIVWKKPQDEFLNSFISSSRVGATSAAKIEFGTAADIYTANATTKMVILGSGNVGIGTTSPQGKFVVSNGGANGLEFYPEGTPNTNTIVSYNRSTNLYQTLKFESSDYSFTNGATTFANIDSSGRLLVGTSSARSNFVVATVNSAFQIEGAEGDFTNQYRSLSLTFNSNNAQGPNIFLAKTRSAANGGVTVVNSGDEVGAIYFCGADGTNLPAAASIIGCVDGAADANDMPGRLVFSTNPGAPATAPTERMIIRSDGIITIKTIGDDIYTGGTHGEAISAGNRCGIHFGNIPAIIPTNGVGGLNDNAVDLGNGAYRWRTIYAGTGTINTSDGNEKQDITALDAAELSVATTIKGLIRKYRFKDAVETKGDDARIHVGVIAQDVEQTFLNEGLDPRRYGMFCEDELEDGSKRLGIRYDELLAFVIAAL